MTKTRTNRSLRRAGIALALALIGCGDAGQPNNPADAPAPPVDAGALDASCFTDPQTYNEIINACTTAVKVYKASRPPLLRPDGSLPALPP